MDYSKFSTDTLKQIASGKPIDYSKLTTDELKEITTSAPGPAAIPEEPGMVEAGLRGAEQGATFGFGDELNGALSAAAQKLQGSPQDLLALYQKNRDESRANFTAAEKAHPTISTVGNVAGALAPALLTGGGSLAAEGAEGAGAAIASGLKTGAGYGALAGLGNSTADLTNPTGANLAQAGKDAATGAALGGAVGGAMGGIGASPIGQGLQNAAGKVVDAGKSVLSIPGQLGVVQDLGEAVKQGLKGRKLFGSEGQKALQTEAAGLSDKLGTNVAQEAAAAMRAQKELVTGADQVEMGDYVQNARDALDKASKAYSGDAGVQSDLQKLSQRLNAWVENHGQMGGESLTMAPTDALHLKRLMSRFGSAADSNSITTGEGQNIANRLIRSPDAEGYTPSIAEDSTGLAPSDPGINDVVESQIPGLGDVNDRLHSLISAGENVPSTAQLLGTESTGKGAATAQEAVGKFLDMLPPDVKENLAPQISDVAKAVKIREKITAKTLGDSNNILSWAGAGIKGATFGGANAAGLAANSLFNMAPEGAQALAKTIASQGSQSATKVANTIAQAYQRQGAQRNALLFALQQNPEYRDIIEQATGQNSVKKTNGQQQ